MHIVGPLMQPKKLQLKGKGEKKEGMIITPAEVTSHENPPQQCFRCLRVYERNGEEQRGKDTTAEALENTALAAWVKGCKAGHEKAVYNTAGKRPLASRKAKASKAPCGEA